MLLLLPPLFQVPFTGAVKFRRHVLIKLPLRVALHFFAVKNQVLVYHNDGLCSIEYESAQKVGKGLVKKPKIKGKYSNLKSHRQSEF